MTSVGNSAYPDGIDEFYEPTEPESTFLSQRGEQGGVPARNHFEHHRDLGDSVQAIQENASVKTHDHSGTFSDRTTGGKLKQENTHQDADTDDSASSIHHTLGTGPFQAAAGDHEHDYGELNNRPYIVCTSTDRPESPFPGMTIYETDTNRMWVYATVGGSSGWRVSPGASVPVVRLAQTTTQPIVASGSLIEWNQKIEDTYGYVTLTNNKATSISVAQPGLYQISVGIQWSVNFIPELVTVVVCRDGEETSLRNSSMQLRSGLLSLLGVSVPSDFSQTLGVSGLIRLSANDSVTVKARYGGSQMPVQGFINTFFDLDSGAQSRLEMHYIGF